MFYKIIFWVNTFNLMVHSLSLGKELALGQSYYVSLSLVILAIITFIVLQPYPEKHTITKNFPDNKEQ